MLRVRALGFGSYGQPGLARRGPGSRRIDLDRMQVDRAQSTQGAQSGGGCLGAITFKAARPCRATARTCRSVQVELRWPVLDGTHSLPGEKRLRSVKAPRAEIRHLGPRLR